jgi:charged multivesicular body protein 4
MKLFAKAKSAHATAPSITDSIARIRETQSTLERRQEYLEKQIVVQRGVAKQNATKNRRVAMHALKRAKMYEAQVQKLADVSLNLETQIQAIESAQVNVLVLGSMRTGTETMRAMHESAGINDVDDIVEEFREQMDMADALSTALSEPLGFGVELDPDTLDSELDALAQEALTDEFLGTNASNTLPPRQSAFIPLPTVDAAAAAAAVASLDRLPSVPIAAPSSGGGTAPNGNGDSAVTTAAAAAARHTPARAAAVAVSVSNAGGEDADDIAALKASMTARV